MKKILQNLEDLDIQIQRIRLSEKSFHTPLGSLITWYKNKLRNYYAFSLFLALFIFSVSIYIGDMLFGTENFIIPALIITIYFSIKWLKIVFLSEEYKKPQIEKIKNLNFTLLSFNILPNIIKQNNNQLKELLIKSPKEITQISENILKIFEKISKYQKILPIFFDKDYIYRVNSLVLSEVELLKSILEKLKIQDLRLLFIKPPRKYRKNNISYKDTKSICIEI